MRFFSAVLIGCITTSLAAIASYPCPFLFSCRCSSTNENYAFCINDPKFQIDKCESDSHCKKCRDLLKRCFECSKDSAGESCLKGHGNENLTHCNNPGLIQHGHMTVFPELNGLRGGAKNSFPKNGDKPEFTTGAILLYACDHGYSLVGNHNLTCGSDGVWSTDVPQCVKRYGDEDLIHCEKPGSIQHGYMTVFPAWGGRREHSNPQKEDKPEFTKGTLLLYACDHEYDMVGNEHLICGPNGSWNTEFPQCIKRPADEDLIYCKNPGSIQHGHLTVFPARTGRQKHSIPKKEDEPEFTPGTLLLYACDEGYSLEGNDYLTCGSHGLWSAALPLCVKRTP